MLKWKILHGHVLEMLRKIPAGVIQMAVTSPPYFGTRRYPIPNVWWGGDPDCDHDPMHFVYKGIDGGKNSPKHHIKGSDNFQSVGDLDEAFCAHCGAWWGQLGQEPTLTMYVEHTLMWARELRRVLRPDGTLWLNLGDTFAASGRGLMGDGNHSLEHGTKQATNKGTLARVSKAPVPDGMKPQDLMLVPPTVAMALRADGWHLRSEITWAKPNAMCESIENRPTKSTERIYLLAAGYPYFYNREDAREPAKTANQAKWDNGENGMHSGERHKGSTRKFSATDPTTRNWRDPWIINTQPTQVQHFAAFPEELATRCILAGSRPGDWVLDPFNGTGRTGQAALKLGRNYIGIDLGEDVYGSSALMEEVTS